MALQAPQIEPPDEIFVDYSVLLSTFTLLFLAEMGDKTQLMAMTLAHRYRIAPVIVGTFAAFLLLNLLAVLVGEGYPGSSRGKLCWLLPAYFSCFSHTVPGLPPTKARMTSPLQITARPGS